MLPIAFFFAFWVYCLAVSASAQIVHVWDLADTGRAGQLTVYNPDRNDAEFGTPVAAGDLDGDGYEDLVVSAMAGDGPDNGRLNAGEVRVYFSPGAIAGTLDLRDERQRVVTLYGEASRDIFGIKTHVADVSGDGRADLLVGAFYADVEGRPDAGRLYVFSGHLLEALLAGQGALDLAGPWPAGVAVFDGPQARSRLGVWMASGDVNGDGFEDIIAGADQAPGLAGEEEAGRAYVVYGPVGEDERIDLAGSARPLTVVYGVDAFDHMGSTVAGGDLDGDGYDEVVLGAAAFGTLRNAYNRRGGAGDGPDNARENAGELYALFGRAEMPAQIDLGAAPPADWLVVYGADGGGDSPDRLGEEIVVADVNGDGAGDLLVGAYRADGPGNSRRDAGELYVVYGSASLRGRTLDMAAPQEGVTIVYGARPGAISGDAAAAGDIHNDGYADLFVGVPGDAGPLGRDASGGMAIIAGGPSLPGEIDLADPQVPVVWIQAPDRFDFSAYWAASGDIDGDGRADPIPNGMAGDGPDNGRDNAGEAHVVSGAALARLLPGQVPTAVRAGEAGKPVSAALGAIYPNPFNASATIPFSLPADGGEYALEIFSAGGQRVRLLERGANAGGARRVIWDGHDDGGRAVAAGTYLVRLRVGREEFAGKLVLVK